MAAKDPAVRWLKEWVPQDVITPGGNCSLLKWVTEETLTTKENCEDPLKQDLEPEATAEFLFLCSYEGCGKTFLNAGALRKHVFSHGARQYTCHYDGCGKKILDGSKLRRHFLTHTGERHFICPYAGCGKAFSLDFNLRSHMKIHSLEYYHLCPYEDCGKKYTHENKLNAHIKAHHMKDKGAESGKHPAQVTGKPNSVKKTPAAVYATPYSNRPFLCPYEGCGKDYIHEYKLNLHLRKEHPSHNTEENNKNRALVGNNVVDEASDHETLMQTLKSIKREKPSSAQQMPPPKVQNRMGTSLLAASIGTGTKQWAVRDTQAEDSEETEEDKEDAESDDSDDETEDEE